MRIFMLPIAFAVVLAGCTRDTGRQFDVSAAKQIHAGRTSMAEVQGYLGQPYQRSTLYGEETWTYTFTHTRSATTATAFIPFMGPLLPGAYKADTESQHVVVKFKDNVVSSCMLILASGHAADAFSGSLNSTTQQGNCDGSPAAAAGSSRN